jgi:hydrogenase large subunit
LQVHDHLVHFYHLHALDWVDVVSALKPIRKRPRSWRRAFRRGRCPRPGYFRDIQNRLKKFVESGQLGPLHERLLGQPGLQAAARSQPDGSDALSGSPRFPEGIVKIHTIYGGKNPHPNWLVGGVPCAINVHDTGAVGAINMERLNLISYIIDRTIEFIDNVYIPICWPSPPSTRTGPLAAACPRRA